MNQSDLKIGYAGMSHLGINSSITAAAKAFKVIAFDYDSKIINDLKLGNTGIDEPQLEEMTKKFKKKINYTSQIKDLIDCDVVYISRDVPTDEKGKSDFKEINKLIKEVNDIISKEAILVILCQVPPGFTRKIQRSSSKLFYQVETLIFGRAIERAMFPERIILGCYDNKHYIEKKLHDFLLCFSCPIIPMIYESAELAKTAINIVLASQVSVANSLAEICENSQGDWSEIIPALNLDKRIGKHAYLSPGLGISGGNIERDLQTLSDISKKVGGNNIFLESIIKLSDYRKKWAQNVFLKESIGKNIKNICILGLSYKINTNSIKNSPTIELINSFKNKDINVKIYDPIIKKLDTFKKVKIFTSVSETIKNADILFIMLPYQEFKDLKWNNFFTLMRQKIVVDPFQVVNENYKTKDMTYYVLGKSKNRL